MSSKYLELSKLPTPKFETVEKLWKGSIDIHIHPIPDIGRVRRVDSMQAAIQGQEAGMRSIVLKSHYYPTTQLADSTRHVAPNIFVFGGLALNYAAGGINPDIVECQAKLGCKFLWMPTLDSVIWRKIIKGENGIDILDANGNLLSEVKKILKTIKQYNMVLANGHLSFRETVTLFEEAKQLGIMKMVVNHPMFDGIGDPMSITEMKQLASMGAYIEHCYRETMPLSGSYNPQKYAEAIKTIGAEHTIMSTDLAQITDPPPSEGMRCFIGTILQLGIGEAEVEKMVKTNPAKLLDLD